MAPDFLGGPHLVGDPAAGRRAPNARIKEAAQCRDEVASEAHPAAPAARRICSIATANPKLSASRTSSLSLSATAARFRAEAA
jgi:hypothetical protein